MASKASHRVLQELRERYIKLWSYFRLLRETEVSLKQESPPPAAKVQTYWLERLRRQLRPPQ